MKNSLKSLLVSVLALALVFSTFGIVVSADTQTTVTVTETETSVRAADGAQIYKLVFEVTTPAGSAGISAATVVFSYDNTVIQPVNKASKNVDVTTAELASGTAKPVKAYYDPEDLANDNGCNFSLTGTQWFTIGTRTGGSIVTSITPDSTGSNLCDATSGMAFLEFYYRVLDTTKMNRETFKFETEYEDGTILKLAYKDPNDARTILVGDYTYNKIGVANTIAEPTWTYTNSDKPAVVAKEDINMEGVALADKTITVGEDATMAVTGAPETVDVTVEYAKQGTGTWSTSVPAEVGKYDVRATFTAKDQEKYNNPETVLNATLTINEKPDKTATLKTEGISTLTDKTGMSFKDLCIVDAKIAFDTTGKEIKSYGVEFQGINAEGKKGGNIYSVNATNDIVIDGEITFKAAIIGVPEGFTVTAVPFVIYK